MIYNADSVLLNTPFTTFLVLKLTVELYIFLWGNNPIYGIKWELFKQENGIDTTYSIPAHILLINNEYRLFLGDESDLPPHTKKTTSIVPRGLNYDQCGAVIFNLLLQMLTEN